MSALSRRDFVAALLGAPALFAGCRAAASPLPDGEFLQPGKAAGHRLRDASSGGGSIGGGGIGGGIDSGAEAIRTERARVVVVGAGASGLAAAWWLARAGVNDLLVLELDDVVGGTSQSGRSALTAYPWGAHYIVAPLPHQQGLVTLLREMGQLEPPGDANAVAEPALCREPEERLFYRGRWYDGLYPRAGAGADDLAQLERFQLEIARWADYRDAAGRRAFALPASAGSDVAEVAALDGQSFASWLDAHGFTSPQLRWLTDYACRDDYGLLAVDTSAWAGVAYFASRLAGKGHAPQPVVTWPEGNGRLTAHLAQGLGPRLRLAHAVARVEAARVASSSAGVDVIARGSDGTLAIRAERVIMATPGFINRRVVRGLAQQGRPEVAVDRGAWAVANLHLNTRPSSRPDDAPLAWDNVFFDSPSLGYVVATHQSGRDHGPTVLTWYYPFTGDGKAARRELDSASREDWAALALADLERAHPGIRAACTRADVAFWGHGMVRPRVGSIFQPGLRAARAPFGPVHFAGSELSGVSLFEEAFDHGVRAADEVLAALGSRA